jgi:hypothetical protein
MDVAVGDRVIITSGQFQYQTGEQMAQEPTEECEG